MINKEVKNTVVLGIVITVALSGVCFYFNKISGILCLVCGTLLTFVFYGYTKKRYNKLNDLNNYLSRVCAGDFDLNIADNTEGELSILSNNLYKVITLLNNQNEMLNKDKTYLAESLADISHQLKTPLTSIMMMTDLMADEHNIEKQHEFLGVIETQLDKMKWLILNLLKLSKLDAGTAEFKKENVLIQKVIENSLKPFLVMLDLKEISVNLDLEDFCFLGDENWSQEAFENIIKNCIEHTDKNGCIKISAFSTNLYNQIDISDNGCGICACDLPHVFERFYHGTNSSNESVGIGLALAKTVFEKENGEIIVESTEGQGTHFTVKLYKAIV